MREKLTNQLPVYLKLVFDLIVVFAVFVIIFIIGIILGAKFFHLNVLDFLNYKQLISHPDALKYVVVLQSVSLFFVPAIVLGYFYSRPAEFLRTRKFPDLTLSALIILAFVFVQGISTNLALLNQKLFSLFDPNSPFIQYLSGSEAQASKITQALLSGKTFSVLFVNLIIVALIPAVSEEFFFRGVLQRHLIEGTRNAHIGIVLTAFLFAFIHFQFKTFLPRFVLGLMLGYIFYWSKTIWASALGHFTNNALGVILYFIANRRNIPVEKINQPQNINWLYALLSLIIVSYIFYAIYQHTKVSNN